MSEAWGAVQVIAGLALMRKAVTHKHELSFWFGRHAHNAQGQRAWSLLPSNGQGPTEPSLRRCAP